MQSFPVVKYFYIFKNTSSGIFSGFVFSTLVFIGRQPIKFGAGYQYYVVKRDSHGPKWAFLLNLTPVIPNILKDLDL